jgi:thioredoxin-dependent peroxiredoxin
LSNNGSDMAELKLGAAAPDFQYQPVGGSPTRLSAHKGRAVVVFFDPRAGSPACTDEVVSFSDRIGDFDALGVDVIGISPDGATKLGRQREKQGLRVPLVSDPEHEIINAWGVWVEKSMYGRAFMGVERATFLVDAEGRIAEIWHRVRVAGHADAVLEAARKMRGS